MFIQGGTFIPDSRVCNYGQENVERFLASLKSDLFTKPNKDEKPYITKDEDIGES